MLWLLPTAFAADMVTLHLGIEPDAGGVEQIAVDGAAGQCTLRPSRITCPASQPVTFRYGPGGEWALSGDTVLEPGRAGVAFVLGPARRAELERLLLEVADDDPLVRRDAVDALHSWTFAAGWGPLPPDAPVPVPPGWLLERAMDPDWRVRRAVIDVARDFRDPDRASEVEEVLVRLSRDRRPPVRRAAIAALAHAARNELVPAELAWDRAVESAGAPGAQGRAAAASLARLSTELDAGQVDPVAALARVMASEPERAWRVWSAWHDDVPYRQDWVILLLTRTNGLNQRLLRHWAATEPDRLAEAIRRWEAVEPHSERFRVARAWLEGVEDAELRAALGY